MNGGIVDFRERHVVVTGGTGNPLDPYRGGGFHISGGIVTVSNNIIEGNDLRGRGPAPEYNDGGGIYVQNTDPAVIEGNVIRNNFGGRGAGIMVNGARVVIESNTIADNVAIGDHGGYMWGKIVKGKDEPKGKG